MAASPDLKRHPYTTMEKRSSYVRVLLAVYLLLAGVVAAWWLMDTRPPLIDPARHLNVSLAYHRYLIHHALTGFATAWFLPYHFYPPSIYISTALLYLLLGTSLVVARATILLFLLCAALATYGIGRRLMNEKAGVLAAILLICYPLILEDSKVYMTEVPLTAMVALGIYLLLRTREFQERSFSLMLGIALGFGALTKWLFPAFVIGPLVLCAIRGFSSASLVRSGSARALQHRLWNLTSMLLLALIVASPWYVLHASQIIGDISRYGYGATGSHYAPPVLSLDSLIYYPYSLMDQLVQLPLVIILAVSLVVLGRNKKLSSLLLSAIIVPMCILFFMRNKQARFLAPVLPSAAVLTAMGLILIASTPWRRGLIVLALALSAANMLAIDFGLPYRSCRVYVPLPGHSPDYPNHNQACVIFQAGVPQTFFGPPRREDWKIDEIVRDVREFSQGTERAAALGLLTAARPCFSEHQFFYAISRRGYSIRPYYLLYGVRRKDHLIRQDLLRRCNFLLAAPLPGKPHYEELLASYIPSSFTLTLLKNYALPDGSTAYLYRCARPR